MHGLVPTLISSQLAHASAFGLTWQMSSTPYDLDFVPGAGTRETTNYANLARDPATRRQNLAVLFSLINQALNLQLEGNSMSSVVSHKRLELFFATFGRFERGAVHPGLICSKV